MFCSAHINSQPTIGIFDSGIGGLSVCQEIRTLIPQANIIYIADNAHLPYGNKPEALIRQRSQSLSQHLISQGADIIVVACNTATAAAIHHLREHFDVPIIGTEPAIKPAAALTKSGIIGVLATENTSKSSRLADLKDRFAKNIQVITQPCHGLVEAIENNHLDTPEVIELLHIYLDPLIQAHADVIILGCTHYPFLKSSIEKIVGKDIKVIDTGFAIARHTQQQLHDLALNQTSFEATKRFLCTDNAAHYNTILPHLYPCNTFFQVVKMSTAK